jgi:TfoX/Sxy family transcriptional regulator of competence genes
VAYDVELAERIREILENERDVTEKRMFGGLSFMVRGRMAVSASRSGGLLVRTDPSDVAGLLSEHVDQARMGGRDMNGWLHIAPAALHTETQLTAWVRRGVDYADTLAVR